MAQSTNGKIYLDEHGQKYIKIRDIGYDLYASLNDDGTYSYCGGCVGPEFGWKTVDYTTEEDNEFLAQIQGAALSLPPNI